MSQEHLGDQWKFEPDPDLENRKATKWDKIRIFLRDMVLVVALLGLLFMSGIYQGTLFQRRPVTSIEKLESIVEGKTIVVPLKVYILTTPDLLGSTRTSEEILELVNNASALWNQARVELVLDDIENLQVSSEEARGFVSNPQQVLSQVVDNDYGGIQAVFAQTLSGLNGIAYSGLRTLSVADYTTGISSRTLAHEVGHVLGLGHTQDTSRLMFSGSDGFVLKIEEALVAREKAEEILEYEQ